MYNIISLLFTRSHNNVKTDGTMKEQKVNTPEGIIY